MVDCSNDGHGDAAAHRPDLSRPLPTPPLLLILLGLQFMQVFQALHVGGGGAQRTMQSVDSLWCSTCDALSLPRVRSLKLVVNQNRFFAETPRPMAEFEIWLKCLFWLNQVHTLSAERDCFDQI